MKSDFKTHQNRNGPSKNGVKESRLVSVTVFLCQPYSVFKVDHLGSTQSHIFGFMTTKTEKKLKLEIKSIISNAMQYWQDVQLNAFLLKLSNFFLCQISRLSFDYIP